jgi:DNA-binding transcriptional LysR family regulator
MEASDLRMFAAVARTGGIGRAAAELNTVQSNVTTRMRQLEAELGAPLLNRHSRGVTLTPAGRRLLPYAARIGDLMGQARRAVADDGLPRGPLILGTLESTAALRLPPLLVSYAARHPEVDLTLRTGTTAELIEAVLDQRLEGALVAGPVAHPALCEEMMFREELVIATAPDIRSLDQLGRDRDVRVIVFRAGCSYRLSLEAILARRGIVGVRRLEFGSLDAIIGCVAAGIGITMFPRAVLARAWRDGAIAIHDLPAAEAQVDTLFIRRRDGFVSSALAAFLDCARPDDALQARDAAE